jgi:hypothetical protein
MLTASLLFGVIHQLSHPLIEQIKKKNEKKKKRMKKYEEGEKKQ